MPRERALKGLFISIGLALVSYILREPLSSIAQDTMAGAIGSYTSWAVAAGNFFENRWAVALSVVAALYFAYRLVLIRQNGER